MSVRTTIYYDKTEAVTYHFYYDEADRERVYMDVFDHDVITTIRIPNRVWDMMLKRGAGIQAARLIEEA